MDTDEVGRVLFGRACRLRLALWIRRQPTQSFFQSQPPADVIAQSVVGDELRRLVALGMLIESRRTGERRVYYRRTTSVLWTVIEAADEALTVQ
ncbi:hypothetical protein [Amycolatopsis sp. NPDC052450]|uniref:hypothetical protein n=1 Tax=Amycolatopsis sp. NPDC052450 TaxID=3363937 RepID=UPI0037C77BE4